jgi:hypothetical protein
MTHCCGRSIIDFNFNNFWVDFLIHLIGWGCWLILDFGAILPYNKIEFSLEIEVWLHLAYFKENRRCLANTPSDSNSSFAISHQFHRLRLLYFQELCLNVESSVEYSGIFYKLAFYLSCSQSQYLLHCHWFESATNVQLCSTLGIVRITTANHDACVKSGWRIYKQPIRFPLDCITARKQTHYTIQMRKMIS